MSQDEGMEVFAGQRKWMGQLSEIISDDCLKLSPSGSYIFSNNSSTNMACSHVTSSE